MVIFDAMKSIFLFVMIATNAFSQNGNRHSINLGVARTALYSSQLFYELDCIEGCYPTKETGGYFFDFNYLFAKNIGKNFFLPIGIGLNQKGFREKGLMSPGSNDLIPYSVSFKEIFISTYIGLSYDFLQKKKFRLNADEFLNPELGLGYPDAFALSNRTQLSCRFHSSHKLSFQVTTFFEFALTDYSDEDPLIPQSKWKPYGIGTSIGLCW